MGHYKMSDLTEMFGVSKHTIYNYISCGAVPPSHGRRYGYYTDEHVEAIRKVREQTIQKQGATIPRTNNKLPGRKAFNSKTRAYVWEQCRGVCHYCNKRLNPFADFDIDHIVPVALGGTNDLSNLVGSCTTCNRRKCTKSYDVAKLLLSGIIQDRA